MHFMLEDHAVCDGCATNGIVVAIRAHDGESPVPTAKLCYKCILESINLLCLCKFEPIRTPGYLTVSLDLIPPPYEVQRQMVGSSRRANHG